VLDYPWAKAAEMLGLKGISVDSPDQIGPAWDEALGANRPVVFEVVTDPEVAPLPPHITFEQAKHFMFSVGKRDPNAGQMIKDSFNQALAGILPGRRS